jgi:hypothetical protein
VLRAERLRRLSIPQQHFDALPVDKAVYIHGHSEPVMARIKVDSIGRLVARSLFRKTHLDLH